LHKRINPRIWRAPQGAYAENREGQDNGDADADRQFWRREEPECSRVEIPLFAQNQSEKTCDQRPRQPPHRNRIKQPVAKVDRESQQERGEDDQQTSNHLGRVKAKTRGRKARGWLGEKSAENVRSYRSAKAPATRAAAAMKKTPS